MQKKNCIIDSINDGLIYLDKKGIILDINRKAVQWFGRSKEELLGRHFTNIGKFSLRDMPRLMKNIKIAHSRNLDFLNLSIKNREGQEIHLECSSALVKRGKSITGIIVIARDVTKNKQIGDALKISEERYRDLVENSGIAILIDDKDGNFTFFNNTSAKLFGYSIEEMKKQSIKSIVHPDDFKRVMKFHKRRILGHQVPSRYEFQGLRKDGSPIYLEVDSVEIREKGKVIGTRSYIWDITERKKMEEALRENEERLNILFEFAPDAYYLTDLSGKLIDGNKAAEEMIGYKREELIGKSFLNLKVLPKNQIHKAIVSLAKNALGRPTGPDEFTLSRKDKSQITVEIRTHPVKINNRIVVLVVARDITERKHAEEERIFLSSAIEQTAEIVLITKIDSSIKYINHALEKITGYRKEEIIGQSPKVFLGDGDENFIDKIQTVLNNGEAWSGLIASRKKDGTTYNAKVTASPIRNNTGNIISHVYVIQDVTQEVRMENQLRQAQKMEALGTLAGGIAHDFNNILTSIIGYTEMAMDDVLYGTLLHSNLKEVLKAGTRGKDLVNQILTFSRQTTQKKKPVQLSIIAKEVLKFLRSSLPSTIKIRQNIKSDSAVIADPTQIHQVLMNLCSNAADAMDLGGGVLELSIEDIELSADFIKKHPDLNSGPYLKLSVSDTGHCIDKSMMKRIFDPFFTTKKPGKGTGLGLSVVHGIVKSHGGAINVNSEPGKGTTFSVFFPRTVSEIVTEKEEMVPIPMGNERILVVDDENQIVNLERQILERLGYQVVALTCPIKAIETFRAQPHSFDLVITDTSMPKSPGDKLVRKLLAIRSDIPIILSTGFNKRMTREKARLFGVSEYIMKPILRKDLAEAVRRVLDQADQGK